MTGQSTQTAQAVADAAPVARRLDDDDFTLFGLERRFRQDASAIAQRWRDLQREVHPDRFAAHGAAAQRVAMQWSTRVNEAHRRLKDPIARGTQLCALAGVDVDAERNTAMPPAFLMAQMQWREALDEARLARGRGETAAARESVLQLQREVAAHEAQSLDRLAAQLDDESNPQAAAQTVRELMFVRRFADDVDGALRG